MDMLRKTRCGLHLKLTHPPRMDFQAMHLTDLSSRLTFNSHPISHLPNSAMQEVTRRCRRYNTLACKVLVKGTQRRVEDSTQIKALNNICKLPPPVHSQELRAGHRNNHQDLAGRGVGRDNSNNTIRRFTRTINGHVLRRDGMMMSTYLRRDCLECVALNDRAHE